jgi:hypothetical protein
VFFELALRGLKATIIFVEQNENVGKKRAAKMPHPNEIFGISIYLLLICEVLLCYQLISMAATLPARASWNLSNFQRQKPSNWGRGLHPRHAL